jgi:hypothetical protein
MFSKKSGFFFDVHSVVFYKNVLINLKRNRPYVPGKKGVLSGVLNIVPYGRFMIVHKSFILSSGNVFKCRWQNFLVKKHQ